ncbi:hypothetical protein U9M48_003448 [Paspalum notatum var. saurae]|uniref:non-specific serine/threonine protein kinase n=1 Tax=Paspalum notatum var. saurae TaxID=547442 RepID=A0AAQ3SI75_PASNO
MCWILVVYLGSGSACQVYQGVLPSGQLVAIKHIHKTTIWESFMREVEQLSNVRHPNLVCLFRYCDERETRSDFVLPWETRVKILKDCTSVLRFLHTHPNGCIVHRDIKVRMLIEICRYNKMRFLLVLLKMHDMEICSHCCTSQTS